jgi:hypothetical protein
MKKSAPVIRVSAARSRESAPSLANWLDAVQVRACSAFAEMETAPAATESASAPRAGAGTAELSDFVSFRIL